MPHKSFDYRNKLSSGGVEPKRGEGLLWWADNSRLSPESKVGDLALRCNDRVKEQCLSVFCVRSSRAAAYAAALASIPRKRH